MKSIIAAIPIILLAGGMLSAQQRGGRPDVISYQGVITSGEGRPFADGEYLVTVTLYGDQGGTTRIWQDTYMTSLRGGVFSLYLGSGSVPLPAPGQMDRPLWIGTRVAGGEEMRPLTMLSASPFAINVPDNAITTEKLADGAVTADKMDLEYISGVSINGKKIPSSDKVLNIQAGKDIEINYDEMSRSLVIGTPGSAGAGQEKKEKADREMQTAPYDAWGAQGDKIDVLTGVTTSATSSDWIGPNSATIFNIRVRGIQIMSYQSQVPGQTPNVVGGYASNSVGPTAMANVIAGGGVPGWLNTMAGGQFNVIGGGVGNTLPNATTVGGAIGGGQGNTIGSGTAIGHYGVIGGGYLNRLTGNLSVIGGGRENSVSNEYTAVGGGIGNIISGWISAVAGGDGNEIHAQKSAIGGGYRNKILSSSDHATIAGGYTNNISGTFGAIGGGRSNQIEGQFSTIGGGFQNHIIPNGSHATIGGGNNNRTQSIATTIAGGEKNIIGADYSAIGGGQFNLIDIPYSMIGGGLSNTIIGTTSAIAGGSGNFIAAPLGGIGGGSGNQITSTGIAAAIPGGENLTAQSYGQAVVGVMNIPSGNLSPGSAPTTEPIFIVGNGILGSPSNAFEVSYDGQSTVFGPSSPPGQAVRGRTGTDNVIYAWGNVDPYGNPICALFGASVRPINTGWYEVTMNITDPYGNPVQISCGSVTATIATQRGPGGGWFSNAIISVSQIVNNVFDVYILDPNGNPVNEAFMFKVTGQP